MYLRFLVGTESKSVGKTNGSIHPTEDESLLEHEFVHTSSPVAQKFEKPAQRRSSYFILVYYGHGWGSEILIQLHLSR